MNNNKHDLEQEFANLRQQSQTSSDSMTSSAHFSDTSFFMGEAEQISQTEAIVPEANAELVSEPEVKPAPVSVSEPFSEPVSAPEISTHENEPRAKSVSFEALKAQLDGMNKDAEKSRAAKEEAEQEKTIEHQLDFQFSKSWNDYFATFKDKIVLEGKSLNSLTEQTHYKGGEINVLFIGDTFDQANHGDDEDLLAKMMGAMKLDKDEALRLFYDPAFDQEAYFTAFFHEIALLKPKFVVSMGATLTNLLLKRQMQLKKVRGNFYDIKLTDGSSQSHSFRLIPIFHPEYLKINPTMKRNTWEDLQKLMKEMGKS